MDYLGLVGFGQCIDIGVPTLPAEGSTTVLGKRSV